MPVLTLILMPVQVVVAQAEYANNESLVPQVTSLITFMQLVGSSVGLACVFLTQSFLFKLFKHNPYVARLKPFSPAS